MKNNLTRKFTKSFATTSLILTLSFVLSTIIVTKFSFDNYKLENQHLRDIKAVKLTEDYYLEEGSFSMNLIRSLASNAINENYYISLYDNSKSLIWGMDRSNRGHMMPQMMGKVNSGNYISNEYPLNFENNIIGYVEIGQYESILMTAEDRSFLKNLTIGLIIAGLFGLLISLLIGYFLAKKLALPIINIKNTTDSIKNGHLSSRESKNYNIVELDDLANSINSLGKSLEDQDSLRLRITTDISHELRTPLQVLKAHIEALIDGIWDASPDRLSSLLEEIDRLTSLVKEIENLNHLEDLDKLKLSKENISEILEKTILSYSTMFKEKNILLTTNIDKNISSTIDKNKILQVFINLISNSIKFTKVGGEIIISLNKENEFIKLEISDTGIGISKEDQNNIFERFYRTDLSRNRNLGGTGLGLSIVKKIILLHNGKIEVESEINKGSIFKIFIPSS